MLDLNFLIPTNSGWSLREATGINDRGQIIGNAYRHGFAGCRAFLLSPSPTLQVRAVGGNGLLLVWPAWSQGFILEENPSLAASVWTSVSVSQTFVDNEVHVLVPTPTGTRFYRLRLP